MRCLQIGLSRKNFFGLIVFCVTLFSGLDSYALDSFTISATRPSKAFACSSVIGDARRKAIDLCKKKGQKINYDTYEVPIVCDWETLSKESFKATIEVKYECRNEEN